MENWKCQLRTAQTGKSKKGLREVCRNMVGKQASMKPGLSFPDFALARQRRHNEAHHPTADAISVARP